MKKLAAILLALLLLAVPAFSAFADEEPPAAPAEQAEPFGPLPESGVMEGPKYTAFAKAALLLEMNTNTITYRMNADDKLYPASLTKIMTCMLALQYGNLDDTVTVSSSALNEKTLLAYEDASSSGLQAGETMSLRDMLYCLMLSSGNDAANAIAEYVSGDIDSFVALMNETAQKIGCTRTHFENAHGLHNENHYTTANDLCLMVRSAMRYPEFKEITSTVEYVIPPTNKSNQRSLTTTNHLISGTAFTDYLYERAYGGKTGFTTPAGCCIAAYATDGKADYLAIILGAAKSTYKDGTDKYENFLEAKDLFNYGFKNFEVVPVSVEEEMLTCPVANGYGKDSVRLEPAQPLFAVLPTGYNSKKLTSSVVIFNENGLEAPVASGETVGQLAAYYDGVKAGAADLLAAEDVRTRPDPVKCGENVTYQLDEYSGQMVISGTGGMTGWTEPSQVPWYASRAAITGVTIEDGVTSVGDYAFGWCENLASVTFGADVTSIGANAFYRCAALTEISMPAGVESIGSAAFSGSGIQTAAVPDMLVSMEQDSFSGCASFKGFTASDSCRSFSADASGVLYNKTKTVLYRCPETLAGAYTAADTVTQIAANAFNGCAALTQITLPESLTTVGDRAFSGCGSLTELSFGQNTQTVGSRALRGCTALKRVEIAAPDCEISPYADTLGVAGTTAVGGFEGSTAQKYASDFGFAFTAMPEDLRPAPKQEEPAETEPVPEETEQSPAETESAAPAAEKKDTGKKVKNTGTVIAIVLVCIAGLLVAGAVIAVVVTAVKNRKKPRD